MLIIFYFFVFCGNFWKNPVLASGQYMNIYHSFWSLLKLHENELNLLIVVVENERKYEQLSRN
jgi:peroxiredoxin family protein